MKRGRALMLGSLNEKVDVNSVVAVAVAQALIEKSTDEYLKYIDLILYTWTQSLFHRMRFFRRMRITEKPESPD